MTTSILLLLAGVVLAWFGGTLFVDGAVGLAKWARWPVAVIGVTVAAFGTSAPELMVAIHAAKDGVPQISLGDVLGSNVVNIALILALVLSCSGMKAEDDGVRRDWSWALAVPFIMMAVLWDGWFSRMDAVILMGLFFFWLVIVVRHARRHRARNKDEIIEAGRTSLLKTVLLVLAGLAMLIGAAQFMVHGGQGVGLALGWSPFVAVSVGVGVGVSVGVAVNVGVAVAVGSGVGDGVEVGSRVRVGVGSGSPPQAVSKPTRSTNRHKYSKRFMGSSPSYRDNRNRATESGCGK